MPSPVRVQIISESTLIEALKAAQTPGLDLAEHQLPDSDQNFGLVEAAAVIATMKAIVELVRALVDVYNEINNDNLEVTIKTVKGTVTVKGERARNVQQLMEQLKDVA